jgi:phosphoserine aminotransferase
MGAARPFNFSAGPATMPPEVLAQAAADMLDWRGQGMSVLEMSHRGAAFESILQQVLSDVRELLAVPPDMAVLLLPGGASLQNSAVPLNLAAPDGTSRGDVVVTGHWSQKTAKSSARHADVHLAHHAGADGFTHIAPASQWQLRLGADWLHLCGNETIHGLEFDQWPNLTALGCHTPLVIDCSSHIASRPMDWSGVAVAYAGTQKNLGPAGLTLVLVRQDCLERASPHCPEVLHYAAQAQANSMLNTPPTYSIYLLGLMLQWLRDQGGTQAMAERNAQKAQLLYRCIDESALYHNAVAPAWRSRMNVPFTLTQPGLDEAFLAGAQAQGLLNLKGHKAVGGMRASLYNAMPLAGVQALVAYMQAFEQSH